MTITKEIVSLADGVTERGQINVKTITRVLEDGVILSETAQRKVLSPGDPVDGESAPVVAVASAVWTPDVIAAWQAGQAPQPQVPQALRKWQVLIGLDGDGIRQQVLDFIATLSQAAQDLWVESTAVERSSPLFVVAKTRLGWTDAQIDDMFARYSQISLGDVTA